jgi:hypothetical protein
MMNTIHSSGGKTLQIADLETTEFDAVAGGPFPLVAAAPYIAAGIAAVGAWVVAKSTDDCTTTTTTRSHGEVTTTVTSTVCN